MQGFHCDKGPAIAMIADGQKKIFEKLDDISEVLANVAVQKKDIDHLAEKVLKLDSSVESQGKRITDLETSDIRRTAVGDVKSKSLGKQVMNAMVITAATICTAFAIGFGGFMLMSHYPAFDQNNKQILTQP